MSYATAAELRLQINTNSTDGSYGNTPLQVILDAVSNLIDMACNRPDGFIADTTASARLYAGGGGTVQDIDECVAITAVAVKDSPTDTTYTAWASGDYIKFSGDPIDPDFNGLPYTGLIVDPTGDESHFTSGRFTQTRGFRPDADELQTRGTPTVQVTAKWGYSVDAPAIVKQVCLIQSARWLKRGLSSHADMMASPDLGTLQFVKATLDNDLTAILERARLVRPAVGRR